MALSGDQNSIRRTKEVSHERSEIDSIAWFCVPRGLAENARAGTSHPDGKLSSQRDVAERSQSKRSRSVSQSGRRRGGADAPQVSSLSRVSKSPVGNRARVHFAERRGMPARGKPKDFMNTEEQPLPEYVRRQKQNRAWHHRLVRAFRWCFVRRLAVRPYRGGKDSNPESWPSRMMWEWQKMPHNWRWF